MQDDRRTYYDLSGSAVRKESGGLGIPTVKPWNLETICGKMVLVKEADPLAKKPFLIKGIMTVSGAEKALALGAHSLRDINRSMLFGY